MRWHPSERWHQGADKEARNKYLIVFSHPHRRDGTGCDLKDVNPRVSATAPGPRGDIKAPLLSRTITTGTCVVSTLYTRGNESSCFHLIGMKIVRSQRSSQHTYLVRYMPPTAPQITEGARMVLRYLVQTRQDKNDSRAKKSATPKFDTVCDNPSW